MFAFKMINRRDKVTFDKLDSVFSVNDNKYVQLLHLQFIKVHIKFDIFFVFFVD